MILEYQNMMLAGVPHKSQCHNLGQSYILETEAVIKSTISRSYCLVLKYESESDVSQINHYPNHLTALIITFYAKL